MSSPVTVSGSASVFEGTVQIRILGADGAEVGRAFATATAGAPERGRFSADVEFDVEGAEDGAVEAFSQNVASPEESPQRKLFRVEVPVRLEPIADQGRRRPKSLRLALPASASSTRFSSIHSGKGTSAGTGSPASCGRWQRTAASASR